MEPENPPSEVTLRDIFPELNDEKLREAEEVLDDYFTFVVRLYDRIRADPEAYADFNTLTAGDDELYDETTKVDLPANDSST